MTLIATSGDRIDVIEAGPSTTTVSGIRIGTMRAGTDPVLADEICA